MPALARLCLLLTLLALAACTGRGQITLAPGTVPGAEVHRLFVATGRAPVEGPARFGGARAAELHFAHFDVSVPPVHRPGRIEWPDLTPDPARHFVTVDEAVYDSEGFRRAIDASLAARAPDDRDVLVFVHGFNNTFAEGLYRQAQITHDFRNPGVVVNYSWPSAGSALGYVHDSDSTLVARDGLTALLRALARTQARRIVLVAHSLGGFLAMESLRQMALEGRGPAWAKISPVILLAPDIDIDVFRAQARRIGTLPEPFLVFASPRDRALLLSARISGAHARLGSVGTEEELTGLGVTVIDTSAVAGGDSLNHMTAVTSPAAIAVLSNLGGYQTALDADQREAGVLPTTLNTTFDLVRNTTRLVLTPLGLILQAVE